MTQHGQSQQTDMENKKKKLYCYIQGHYFCWSFAAILMHEQTCAEWAVYERFSLYLSIQINLSNINM